MAKEQRLPENDDFFAFYGDESAQSAPQASAEAQRAPRSPGVLRRLGTTAMNFARTQLAPQTGRHALGRGETWEAGTQKRVGQILAEERAYTGKMTMREVAAYDAKRNPVKPVPAVIGGRNSVFEQVTDQPGRHSVEAQHTPSADSIVTTWESGAGMPVRGEGAEQMPGAELPADLYRPGAHALPEDHPSNQIAARHAAEYTGAHHAQ
ncbi:MAG TPA: hypothetical protein VLH86_03585 [Patescibacteria group bacterium]|nr:hypothetical protein [Patescibacteria group bacterium]